MTSIGAPPVVSRQKLWLQKHSFHSFCRICGNSFFRWTVCRSFLRSQDIIRLDAWPGRIIKEEWLDRTEWECVYPIYHWRNDVSPQMDKIPYLSAFGWAGYKRKWDWSDWAETCGIEQTQSDLCKEFCFCESDKGRAGSPGARCPEVWHIDIWKSVSRSSGSLPVRRK